MFDTMWSFLAVQQQQLLFLCARLGLEPPPPLPARPPSPPPLAARPPLPPPRPPLKPFAPKPFLHQISTTASKKRSRQHQQATPQTAPKRSYSTTSPAPQISPKPSAKSAPKQTLDGTHRHPYSLPNTTCAPTKHATNNNSHNPQVLLLHNEELKATGRCDWWPPWRYVITAPNALGRVEWRPPWGVPTVLEDKDVFERWALIRTCRPQPYHNSHPCNPPFSHEVHVQACLLILSFVIDHLESVPIRNLPYPSNPDELHEVSKSEKVQERLLCHTETFKFLDKAAIIDEQDYSDDKQHNPWRLSTVTRVEEMKLLLNMIPIWLTSLPFGICVAQTTTFFIKQGALMNREITQSFILPPASIFSLTACGMILSVTVYDRILVPLSRRITRTERGITILQRIGIGMVFSVTTMIISAIVEKKRLTVVQNSSLHNSATMSVFWLAPQFIIIGIADGFTLVGLQEYFYDQVPDSLRSLGIALYLSVIGAANFLSSFLITIVDHVTTKVSGTSWFGKNLNSSRLDHFYLLLAVITASNLCVYVFLTSRYSYKNVQRKTQVAVADCYQAEDHSTRG
ncbi:putative proton-dependent oligopeptide transporter family, major facilitator superfamily [Helianthus annuus]|nr:putative proton-dependent oligopeptide transporter family, major facilitator superfamily [Helianthus annuus]